ncbi:hypothetical protein GCM10027275_03830 [Rhabdobacter roseus]|uniref:RNA polymerase sigma factor (Sigma-70 family) n=1 Tax=Rhabdobacter roseus TaxID=1655419 RepID=A0A840TL32_9BACT|nr:sigma-70 family RNA polymerase sigma factor [Rhabdobacter roseus]MBB5282272.1 RNA polymerase sigma factor (sigma-70 family) [Rhabdobacter roseus]
MSTPFISTKVKFITYSSDEQIITDILTGGRTREEATRSLIHHHVSYIYKLHRQLRISEDVAKDTFTDTIMAVIQQIESGTFRGESKLSSYLYQIYYFKMIDSVRKKHSKAIQYYDEMAEVEDTSANLEMTYEAQERASQVARIMNKMCPLCRKILLMWGLEGKKIGEIAQQLGETDPKKISRKKYKCMDQLRELWNEQL